MIVVKTKAELASQLQQLHAKHVGKELALVPTMGGLHAGHVKLFQQAKTHGLCATSIFVNPLQFNSTSDYESYPCDKPRDLEICAQNGVDLVFMPTGEEMYAQKPLLELRMPELCTSLCGVSRPGHFEGVMSVVLRLLNLFQADFAIFGKKDYQQYQIICRLVKDLDLSTKIIGVETVREDDGLAYSSRNMLLSEEARQHATLLYRALKIAAKACADGQKNPKELEEIIKDVVLSGTLNRIDYISIVEPETLKELEALPIAGNFLFALAIFCDKVRLLDNLEYSDE